MNVTEQLDALRVMGADPIRVLVVPRFLACVLMTPMLTIYSDVLGMLGGWFIAVKTLRHAQWPLLGIFAHGRRSLADIEGLVKSVFFGGAIGLIGCYKGFTLRRGRQRRRAACTESFVASFIAIIVFNFFFAQVAKDWYISALRREELVRGEDRDLIRRSDPPL